MTIAWIIWISMPIYFLIVYAYNRKIIKAQKGVMQSYALNESQYIDSIQGMDIIQSYRKEDYYKAQVETVFQNFQERIFDLGLIRLKFSRVSEFVGVVLNVAILSTCAFFVFQQELLLGEMMAIISVSGSIIPAVGRLAVSNIPLQEAKIAFERLFELIENDLEKHKQTETYKLDTFENLKVKNLSFRFAGHSPLFQNINLEIKAGEVLALLGENGSGKSTIMHILERFYDYEKGLIEVNGQDLRSINLDNWRKKVISVPQNTKIFNSTVLENICLDKPQTHAESVIKFCQEMGLAPYFEKLPKAYFTLVGEEGINLSGGQKQLIALTRALYHQPQLLLLDEATSAMDRQTEQFVLKLLEKLKKQGLAIFMITHHIKTANKADRIYILEDKSITASGTPSELLESENLFSLIYQDTQLNKDY